MALRSPRHLPARDLVPSSSASAAGPVAVDKLAAELSPHCHRDIPAPGSDFQRMASQIVQLSKALTGASGAAIAFRGEQGTICLARSGEGAPPLGALVDSTSGISKECLDSGRSLRCDDIAADGGVDPETAKSIGIRAVAVVPIFSSGKISGILEVVSNTPSTFTDQHLKSLQQLANWIGSATNTLGEEPICGANVDVQLNGHSDITLLVEFEPACRAFFRNLVDLLSPGSPTRLAGSSSQMHGWNDVLVESRIPWQRFLESVFLHIVAVGMLSGLSKLGPREVLVSPPPLREAHVTYYPSSQSSPARESSRPAEQSRREHPSAHRDAIGAGRDPEPPRLASDNGDTDDGQKIRKLGAPLAMPEFAISRLRKPGFGPATAILPPPDIEQAEARRPHLPIFPVVAPPPTLSGGPGLWRINAPRAAVVPPPPDVRGSTTRTGLIDAGRFRGGSTGVADISIVPPPPSINDHAVLTYGATGGISETGLQVVGPAPSIQARAELDARGVASPLAGGGSQVVPPAPSLEGSGKFVGGGRLNSLANGGSRVVPPPPSVDGGDNSGAGGRASSLARTGAEGGLPPTSAQGEGNAGLGGASFAQNASTQSVPDVGASRMHPVFQDLQLRVIGLVWTPPRSSYYSNFEVFIAEKWLNKKELQFIKLVYVFLPYQQRLSEYGFDTMKVRRLRVTRDPTCDESLMQMTWPEGENGPADSRPSGNALASTSSDRDNMLPCYRTTADDYRRSVSRSR